MVNDVVDADSHIIEPRDTWVAYLARHHADIALRIVDEPFEIDGFHGNRSYLKFQDRKLFEVAGVAPLGTELLRKQSERIFTNPVTALSREGYGQIQKCVMPYDYQSPAAAWDPVARLQWMSERRIGQALITPTWGSMWEQHLAGFPSAITANMTAYNRWLLSFCSTDSARLVPVGQLSLVDTVWAEQELQELSAMGVPAILLRPVLYAGLPLGHANFDRFWSALEDANMAVYFHIAGCGTGDEFFFDKAWFFDEATGQHSGLTWAVMSHVPVMLALTNMVRMGVFRRHPRLRVAVVEQGAGWVKPWLDLFDDAIHLAYLKDPALRVNCPELPSTYINAHVWFTALDSESLPEILRTVPHDRLLFSSDYPHPESPFDPVAEFSDRLGNVEAGLAKRLMSLNAQEYIRGSAAVVN
ncbi:amidohydrolase family protein [Rhizobium leguminosarum]|uniref:amidohydrolase family protein n=1 Tax=Rhizobium leguminosarum TaxID=384 RepID=UPI001C946C7C|nr:amidohydrolase family protein [Rhizobium leguminosarum]MBY5422313.1 amidohydrolase family protein [Rhizobium leguminosarum]